MSKHAVNDMLVKDNQRPWWHHFLLFGMGTILFTVPYLLSNEFSAQRAHHHRFYFDWELAHIPFVSWMIIPYVGAYLVPFITIWRLRWHENKALVWSIAISAAIGTTFFLFFPTILGFERDLSKTGIWAPLYEWLWYADRPHNLCPSMHVVMAYLLIVPVVEVWHSMMARFFLLSALIMISLSILFVHQHHVLDLIAGLELGILVHLFVYRPLVQRFAPKAPVAEVAPSKSHLRDAA